MDRNNNKLLLKAAPCPECTSSDAYHVYEDPDGKAHGYCYSCSAYHKHKEASEYLMKTPSDRHMDTNNTIVDMQESTPSLYNSNTNSIHKGTPLVQSFRSISTNTLNYYGVTTVDNKLLFPYGSFAQKVRLLDKKEFYAKGEFSKAPLFGQDKFSAGSAKTITITEGELDAMSVFEMMGKYPVLSVKGSSSAERDCAANYNYINSFDKIYLCFDNDGPGQKAMQQVAKLFNVNKVHHVLMDKYKDANEYLTKGAIKEFQALWWNAKRYRPKGVVSSFEELRGLLEKRDANRIAEYPFPTLEASSYGIREGEAVLWKAQTGQGKTEVLRAIEYNILNTTDHNIGIIHLEEEERRSIAGLAGYKLKRAVHLPDSGVSNDEIFEAYRQLVKRDDRVYYYTHFGSDDPEIIIEMIRYLAGVCQCKVIFLDHISMVVSGHNDDEDERRKLDRISTELAQMTRELNFNLQFVSHVNDNGQTRGSRNISKVADLIIDISRDHTNADEVTRNTTRLLIEKNRFGSTTGPAGKLYFDRNTFTLEEKSEEELGQIRDDQIPF